MSQSDYIDQIILNIYRLEGDIGARESANIGTTKETRLENAIASLQKIVDDSKRARGENPGDTALKVRRG